MDTYFIFPFFVVFLPINSAWVISAGSLDLGTERVKTGNRKYPPLSECVTMLQYIRGDDELVNKDDRSLRSFREA